MPGREKGAGNKIYWVRINPGLRVTYCRNNKAPVLLPAQEGSSRQKGINTYDQAGFGR